MDRDQWYEKITSRIIIDNNWCHIWQWAKNDSWYGVQCIDGKFWYVHRFIYDYIYWINEWMTIDHVCKNPLCCNINHLRELTFKENAYQWVISSAEKNRKTFCNKHSIPRERHWNHFHCNVCLYEYYLFRKHWIKFDITYDGYMKLKHNQCKQKEKVICCWCWKEFYDIPCKKRKYCSCKCAEQNIKNTKIEYKDMIFKSILSFCKHVWISKTTFYRIKNKISKNKVWAFIFNGITY